MLYEKKYKKYSKAAQSLYMSKWRTHIVESKAEPLNNHKTLSQAESKETLLTYNPENVPNDCEKCSWQQGSYLLFAKALKPVH